MNASAATPSQRSKNRPRGTRFLERRLADSDTPQAVTREARRLGYVEPGERLFIVKGIAAWRRNHEAKDKR